MTGDALWPEILATPTWHPATGIPTRKLLIKRGNRGASPRTPAADKLEVLVTLVDAYESRHHPIDPPDPIDAIRFRLEQMGLTRRDLTDIIGSRARISEVFIRRRPLTIAMIAKLRDRLGISADVLIGPQRRAA